LRDLRTKTKSSRMDSEMALLYQVAFFLPKCILSSVDMLNNAQVTPEVRAWSEDLLWTTVVASRAQNYKHPRVLLQGR
jgi:hypothetical protein